MKLYRYTSFALITTLISLSSFGVGENLGTTNKQNKAPKTPDVKVQTNQTSAQKNENMKRMQMMMIQQQMQSQAQLLKMRQEEQNLRAALDTISRNKAKHQNLQNPVVMKGAVKQEKQMKDRLAVLAKEIPSLEKQLNQQNIK